MVASPIITTRTKRVLLTTASFAAATSLVIYSLSAHNPLSHTECQGVLLHQKNDFYTDVSVVLKFYDDHHADITLSGVTYDQNKIKLNMFRKLTFNYRYGGNGMFTMSEIKINKYSNDDVSDDYFRRNIVDFAGESGRVTLRKFRNAYLVYNSYSSVLVCERKALSRYYNA